MSINHNVTQQEYAEAAERGKAAPRAIHIQCFPRKRVFQMELANHTMLTFPAALLSDLKDATAAQLSDAKLMFDGTHVWWDSIDVQHTVEYIASKAVNLTTARQAAMAASRSKSPRKAAAARANGRLGGRPVKSKVKVG